MLSTIYKLANNGNVKAAKVFIDATTAIQPLSKVNNTQNNYIQINQTKLSQETIKQLSPEQLEQIENVLQKVVSNGR